MQNEPRYNRPSDDGYEPRMRSRLPRTILIVFLALIVLSTGWQLLTGWNNSDTIELINFDPANMNLNINLSSNGVYLTTHRGSDVRVTYTPPRFGNFTVPTYEFSRDSLDIIEDQSFQAWGLFNIININTGGLLTVYVPENMEGFSELSIRTSSGRVEITGSRGLVLGDRVSLRASSGRITARDFSAGSLDIDASSGRIDLDTVNVTGGNLTARASSGRVELNEIYVPHGGLTARTSSGSVTADNLSVAENLSLTSTSGRVSAENTNAASNFSMNATSGSVTASGLNVTGDLSMVSSSGRIALENSDVQGRLEARATSGSVTLNNVRADRNRTYLRTSSGRITVDGQRQR